jgi:predicted transcriptional regulator
MQATTTIQITSEVKKTLDSMKLYSRETYNELIERLLEDSKELNKETKKEIKKAEEEIKAGKFKTHEELGAELEF